MEHLEKSFQNSTLSWNTVLVTTLLAVVFGFLYLRHVYSYWERKGVRGPRPIPFFGNVWSRAAKLSTIVDMDWKAKYGNIYGIYTGILPTLTITDSELVRQVMVKDFQMFSTRRRLNTYDRYWNYNLLNLEYHHRRKIRASLTPNFSTRKLRAMNVLMGQCVEKLCRYLDRLTTTSGETEAMLSVKEVMTGFTVDVVASTIFGIETNANNCDRRHTAVLSKEENQTVSIVKMAMEFWQVNKPKFIMAFSFGPMINRLFGIHTQFNDDSYEYFVKLIQTVTRKRTETIKSGTKVGEDEQVRFDLIQLLLEAEIDEHDEVGSSNDDKLTATGEHQRHEAPGPVSNGNGVASSSSLSKDNNNNTILPNKRKLTEAEVVAQSLIFFVAGFETTANTLTFALYELAKNRDIQERLYQEIQTVLGTHTKLDDRRSDEYYEKVMGQMPYLDAVIKETMRIHPMLTRLERRVMVDRYDLAGIELRRGQLIEIPIYPIHHNPEYYPNPGQFQPDRFMPENKDRLVPYSFLPFGAGPRNCIGMRFAYQEIRLVLVSMIAQYRFESTEHTKIELVPNAIVLSTKPFPVRVIRR